MLFLISIDSYTADSVTNKNAVDVIFNTGQFYFRSRVKSYQPNYTILPQTTTRGTN
jgi:hypothetical protein